MKCIKTESPIHGIEAVLTIPTTFAFTDFVVVKQMHVKRSLFAIHIVGLVMFAISFVIVLNLNDANVSARRLLSAMGVTSQDINAQFRSNMTIMPSLPTECIPNA
jgi:hypothetical protein